MRLILLSFLLFASYLLVAQTVRITGILDGTLPGGEPKVIELYISGTVDLSDFDLQRSSNGGAFNTTANLSGTYTNEFVYLVSMSNIPEFESIFGTSGDFANVITIGIVTGNGNDGFRLVETGTNTVVDVFDPANANVYEDSWVRRNDNAGPSTTYDASEWTFGGNNALDGEDAAGIGAMVPFGAYLLPVSLSKLSAKANDLTTQLFFTTATEENNSHFLIQRSGDGRVFETIGRVEGKGDSNQAIDYQFTDTKPQTGLNYYRLQQFDFDGTTEFFGPISVRFQGDIGTAPSIWPVPADNRLEVSLPDADRRDWLLEIYDLNGRRLLQQRSEEKTNSTTLDVSSLPAGSYLFRWLNGQNRGQQLFVKL